MWWSPSVFSTTAVALVHSLPDLEVPEAMSVTSTSFAFFSSNNMATCF